MKCNKCGTELLPDDVFCGNCGERIVIPYSATRGGSEDASERYTASEKQAATGKQAALKKVSVIITAIAVVLVLSVVVLYTVYYRPKKATHDTGVDDIRRSSAMEESVSSGKVRNANEDDDNGVTAAAVTVSPADEITTVNKTEKTTAAKEEKTTVISTQKPTSSDAERYDAYVATLRTIVNDRRLPDGMELTADYIESNKFAVFDVDSDNRDELIIEITNTAVANMHTCVYDYDSAAKELVQEARFGPEAMFFTNGIIRSDGSHNQTPSTFWPYHVLKYDPDTDTYQEKSDFYYSAVDQDKSTNFDRSADKDGDGRIFRISWDDDSGYIDNRDYENHVAALMGTDYEFLPIPYRWMTSENVDDLSANGPRRNVDRVLSMGSGTVTGTGLRVRKGPGTEYDICGEIKKGTRFELYDYTDGNYNNDGWGMIGYGKNKFGWISLAYADYQVSMQ